MWAIGVFDLGLTNEGFWSLTPRQFLKLTDRYKAQLARQDRRAGEIVAMLYNLKRDSKKDPNGWNWLDVFPEHKPPKPVQTDDEMFNAMMLWTKVTPLPS